MASTPPLRYGLYGLTNGNPYVTKALDPLTRPGDREHCLELDGFFEVERVREYLHESIENERSAIVIVSGRDKTGRTSIANYVLYLYRELRGVEDRFVTSRLKIAHNRDMEWPQNALIQLKNEIEVQGIQLANDKLTEYLDRIEDIRESSYQSRYQHIARLLCQDLAGRTVDPYAFGMLFEGLRTVSLVDAMQTILQSSESIAVFTHGDYLHAETPSSDELRSTDAHIMCLEPLVSSQVRHLAEARWRQASPLPSPFDPDGLEEAWAAPTPIKKAIRDLARLVDHKLQLASDDHPWPDNEKLAITREYLVATIRVWGSR